MLLYTSGTSGRPRAAMLSHRALLANIEQVAQVEPQMITGRDVVLGVLPLFHVYGLNAVLGRSCASTPGWCSSTASTPRGRSTSSRTRRSRWCPSRPPVFAYWMQVPGLEDRLGPVRLVLSGSAPLDPELTAAFTARTNVDIHQGYGLTEAAPVVTSTLCSKEPTPRSVGAALPGIEIRLVDDAGHEPRGRGRRRDPHPRGQPVLRLLARRRRRPRRRGLVGAPATSATSTRRGDLYLVDRLKELVIVSGFNVYPSEVEDVITELPEVAEAAVIGVDDDSHRRGGRRLREADRGRRERRPRRRRARATAQDRLARFKQPSVIHVVEELPYTVTGKVQKGRLRATERRRALGLLE